MMKKNKFMKKAVPLIITLTLIVIPFDSLIGLAYTGTDWLLDNSSMILSGGGTALTDNDLTTSVWNRTVTIELTEPVDINKYYYKGQVTGWIKINFYDSAGTRLAQKGDANGEFSLSLTGVKKITISNTYDPNNRTYNEFDISGKPSNAPVHNELANFTYSVNDNDVVLNYKIPSGNTAYIGSKIYRDGELISTLGSTTNSYIDYDLAYKSSHSYKVTAIYIDGYETTGLTQNVTLPSKPYEEINNLNATLTYHSANLSWSIPDHPNLIGFKIYRNNSLIKTLDLTENYYLDDGLNDLTSYKYKVTSIYDDGYETQGLEKIFTTSENPVVKKVANADAKAVSYKQINISWDLPNQSGFHHVNIYRAVKPKEQGFFERLLGSITSADTTPTEIFETNGTYFNDLTVKPDTNYEYMLTTETTDGRVSDEVTVTADTPSEPTPELKTDGNYTVNQDGGYVFKWTTPTTGKVKVLIDGKDYKIVDASLKEITIPKADIKTNTWGDPSVSMIPVGEFGTEGKEVFTGGNSFLKSLKLPINTSDLLTTSIGILGLVAPIILLVLVIYYFKPIKRLIVNAALKIKEKRGLKT
jgi:hypothetical protein